VIQRSTKWVKAGLSAIALGAAALPGDGRAESTLRIVMSSDLKIVDPVWSSIQISRTHGYLVYDTLFSVDADLKPRPQMVERHAVSADGLEYTLTLREGLTWHDGTPVTAADCVASLQRWMPRDTMGQKLLANLKELVAVDPRTIRLTLSGPYAFVLESLAKPGGVVPFMMPERLAKTPGNQQITESVGSGPFKFKADEWKPGEKTVYVKNETYKPRPEPPSNFAGGKVAKLDRVEWVAIPDPQTAVSALQAGEIDAVELISVDLLPLVEGDKSLAIVRSAFPNQFSLRPNWLHPPFDNPKVREALGYLVNQPDFVIAAMGDPRFYRLCKSYFVCGTPLASDVGMEGRLEGNVAKARELLAEAGYKGEPIVLLHATDVPAIARLAPVAKAQLERAGFKVDMQSMDWQTQISRFVRRDPPDQRGWNLVTASWGALDVVDPVVSAFLNAACDKATGGWPCDKAMEELRDRFAREQDPAKRKAIAAEIQTLAVRAGMYFPLGEWFNIGAYSTKVHGILATPAATVFWNMEKTAR